MRAAWAWGVVAAGWVGCATTKVADAPADLRSFLAAKGPLTLEAPRWPNGETYSLAQARGRVVLLDVWATWCEPCRDALPAYAQLAEELSSQGLDVVTLNVDADDNALKPYVAGANLRLPILRDPGARLAESTLRLQMMPTSFLLDRKGVVRFVHEGLEGDFVAALKKDLSTLLAEAP